MWWVLLRGGLVGGFRGLLGVVLAVLSAFAGTLAFRVSVPAVAFYVRFVLESSVFGVGLLTTAFFGARALSSVWSGRLFDRLGGRLLYVSSAAFVCNAGVTLLYCAASTLPEVLAVKAAQGVLNGLAWVPMQAALGAAAPEGVRGRAYSAYFIAGSVGGMVGNAAYAALASAPLAAPITLSAAAFTASSAMAAALGRELEVAGLRLKPRRRGGGGAVGRGAAARGASLPLLIAASASPALLASVVRGSLIYVYMSSAYGLSKAAAAAFVAAASTASLPASYFISWAADRFGGRAALTSSLAACVAGAALLGFRDPAAGIAGLALAYVGLAGAVPVIRRVASLMAGGGAALGAVNAAANLGNVCGAAIAGYVSTVVPPALPYEPVALLMALPAGSVAACLALRGRHP